MKFKDLKKSDKDLIERIYKTKDSRKEAQELLSDIFDVSERSIRNWAHELGLGRLPQNITRASKILIYDIETCRVPAMVWWAGKQYIHSRQLTEEPRIITVAWKWLGEDEVSYLTWDKEHSDRKLMEEFLKVYNDADMVVGQNNDNFDNRWINARAMKYGLEVNTHVKSMDIMKQSKRLFRVAGYSMAYLAQFSNVTHKQGHEGMIMWDKIQFGTPEEQEEYLQKMVDYNVGDIVTTEELYVRLRPYLKHQVHFGVMAGGEKWTCPNTGSEDVYLSSTTVTKAGTVQRIMKSPDGSTYKISNKQYMNFLDYKIRNNGEKN